MMPTLIFCAGKSRRYYEIAAEAGFLYGAQLPCTTYGPVYFADQNYEDPDRQKYMTALAKHRPYIASVLDWERPEQLPEILSWAEEAAQFVEVVMIIPKVHGGVKSIPRRIGGKPVRLGYSVPTSHGGTDLFLSEFIGWPVHLLGGSPGAQMRLARYLDVKSVDGNMHMKQANELGAFWTSGKKLFSNRWVTLKQADGKRWDGDGNYEAFRRSCENIVASWERMTQKERVG